MWTLAGLAHLSDQEHYLLLLIAVCCAFAVGWIMDMIMGRVGFGIFGNAGVTLIGIFVGLMTYHNYYGRMTSPEISVVIAFAIASVMLHLVVLSVMRRMMRL
jgi:ABC-type branched-subunit amino acid transport system permease subunit